MGILDNVLGRKIEFSKEMKKIIEDFKGIEFFKNCGKLYNKKLFYDYRVENGCNIKKQLNRKTNYKEFVILENLFIVASRRLENYLNNNSKKDHEWTYNKLADTINKRFSKNTSEINFPEIDKNYCNKFLVRNTRIIYQLFRNILFELYFIEYIPKVPIFYNHIFELYKEGHIIIGWEGKSIEKEIWSQESIKQSDGKIIIY